MKTIKDLFAFIFCIIYMNVGFEFFFKKLAHAYLYASIFLSLLAGKFCPFEQSAGVKQVMEIFKRSKMQMIQRKQALNQRMCKRTKVRLSFFLTLTL